MYFNTLRAKLVFAMVCLAVLAAGLPGSYLVWKSYAGLRQQAQEGQLALARSLAAQVDQNFSQAIQALETLAKRKELASMEPVAQLKALSLVSTATELFEGTLVILPDGKILAQNWAPGNSPSLTLPPQSSFRAAYRQLKKLHEPVLSEIFNIRADDLAVAINVPILKKTRVPGMLSGVLELSTLGVGNLEDIKIGPSGYAYMVDEKGEAIVHPKHSKLLADFSRHPEVAALVKQEEGVVEYSSEGQGVLAAFVRIESVPGWGMIVHQNASECYAQAVHMRNVLVVFLGLAVLGSAGLALILARLLVKPLLILSSEVKRIETGRLNSSVLQKLNSRDEIGSLAGALFHMAQALKTQQTEREKAYQRALSAEKRLAEAEKLAALGQLSAGLAHELNNPLAVILGSAREAGMGAQAAARPWIERILKETQRCQRLVKDLLDFARPLRLQKRRFKLHSVIQEAWLQARQSRGQEYGLTLPAQPVELSADYDRLKQVFINLFSNALDAMPAGGTITVKSETKGRLVRLSIRDPGIGFPRGDLAALFRPFYTTKDHGTGLGLSICRSILTAHAGKLWAQRPRGKGALFIMELPL